MHAMFCCRFTDHLIVSPEWVQKYTVRVEVRRDRDSALGAEVVFRPPARQGAATAAAAGQQHQHAELVEFLAHLPPQGRTVGTGAGGASGAEGAGGGVGAGAATITIDDDSDSGSGSDPGFNRAEDQQLQEALRLSAAAAEVAQCASAEGEQSALQRAISSSLWDQ